MIIHLIHSVLRALIVVAYSAVFCLYSISEVCIYLAKPPRGINKVIFLSEYMSKMYATMQQRKACSKTQNTHYDYFEQLKYKMFWLSSLQGDQSCHCAAPAGEPLPLETPPRAQPHHWRQAGSRQERQQVVLLELVRWLGSTSPPPPPQPHPTRTVSSVQQQPDRHTTPCRHEPVWKNCWVLFFFSCDVLTSVCCFWTELSLEEDKGRVDETSSCLASPRNFCKCYKSAKTTVLLLCLPHNNDDGDDDIKRINYDLCFNVLICSKTQKRKACVYVCACAFQTINMSIKKGPWKRTVFYVLTRWFLHVHIYMYIRYIKPWFHNYIECYVQYFVISSLEALMNYHGVIWLVGGWDRIFLQVIK